MIILTTPNGLHVFDTHTNKVRCVVEGNFFGITKGERQSIIVSQKVEDNFILRTLGYHFEDIKEPYETMSKDVHQILYNDNKLFITDTGNDGINCLDFSTAEEYVAVKTECYGEDHHHINALCVVGDTLCIGFNKNSINTNSSIGFVSLSALEYFKTIVLDSDSCLKKLNGVIHSHDICIYNNDLLISASQQGFIYSYNNRNPLFKTSESWTRGLVVNDMGIWVGYSATTIKENRNRNIECSINRFEHNTFKHLESVKLKSGQICDMIYIPKNLLNGNI